MVGLRTPTLSDSCSPQCPFVRPLLPSCLPLRAGTDVLASSGTGQGFAFGHDVRLACDPSVATSSAWLAITLDPYFVKCAPQPLLLHLWESRVRNGAPRGRRIQALRPTGGHLGTTMDSSSKLRLPPLRLLP